MIKRRLRPIRTGCHQVHGDIAGARARGFTLIEIIAVMTIMAIMSVATIVVLNSQDVERVRANDAIARVIDFDRLARIYARRFNEPSTLIYRIRQREMYREDRDEKRRRPGLRQRLPRGWRIERIESVEQRRGSGQVEILCSPHGRTPTYAVKLVGPKEDQEGNEVWLVFAGLTGDVSQVESEREIRSILRPLQPPKAVTGSAS